VPSLVATSSISRHRDTRDKKKRKRISRRVRRLEKTVESLSHGLILALTELKNRTTTADGRKQTILAWSMRYLQRFPAFLL
jgi:hypothetical protein